MNYWYKNSETNLLPLSASQVFAEALQEWEFRGDFIDHLEAVEICHLCEHESLRYHFKVMNTKTHKSLWVGSSCICKFTGIRVFDESGELVEGEHRRKVLEQRIERDRFERMKRELDVLWNRLKSPAYARNVSPAIVQTVRKCVVLASEEAHEGFTPYEVIGLFRNMERLNVAYTPGLYKINLRTDQAKTEIQAVRDMEKCLSLEQRKRHDFLFAGEEERETP